MQTQTFFNEVNQATLSELVEFMVHTQTKINIKLIDQYIILKILSKKNEGLFNVSKLESYDFINKPISCHFNFGNDKYFFKSRLNTNNSGWTIDIPAAILQLQRRNDYRATMPKSLFYKCEIISINGLKKSINIKIRDMSLGGCQISTENSNVEIKQDDELEVYLKVHKFEFQKIRLKVQRLSPADSQNSITIGARLYAPDSELNTELQSMLIYLDRVNRGKEEG